MQIQGRNVFQILKFDLYPEIAEVKGRNVKPTEKIAYTRWLNSSQLTRFNNRKIKLNLCDYPIKAP